MTNEEGALAYRIVNGVWALIFVWSALVQLNDPDPLKWVAVYLASAVPCAVAVAGRPVPRWMSGGLLAICAAWALWILVSTDDVGAPMDHGPGGVLAYEVVREGLGLGLCAVWMAVLLARPGGGEPTA